MRLSVKGKVYIDKQKWHRWFVWLPKRFPSSRYQDGQWVWLEYIERKIRYEYTHWDDWITVKEYRLPQGGSS